MSRSELGVPSGKRTTDYLADCIPAGNRVQTNQDIDQITVPKSDHANAAFTRAACPCVTVRFNLVVAAVTRLWMREGERGRMYEPGKERASYSPVRRDPNSPPLDNVLGETTLEGIVRVLEIPRELLGL